MSTPLPKTVPVLAAKDMHQGSFHSPDGTRHCILGWAGIVCDNHPETSLTPLFEKLKIGDNTSFVGFNDRERPSVVADAWNAAAEAVGYVRRGSKFVLPTKKARAAR